MCIVFIVVVYVIIVSILKEGKWILHDGGGFFKRVMRRKKVEDMGGVAEGKTRRRGNNGKVKKIGDLGG